MELKDIPIREGLVPNVVGMGAKDAVYLLESVGLRASLNGMGGYLLNPYLPVHGFRKDKPFH